MHPAAGLHGQRTDPIDGHHLGFDRSCLRVHQAIGPAGRPHSCRRRRDDGLVLGVDRETHPQGPDDVHGTPQRLSGRGWQAARGRPQEGLEADHEAGLGHRRQLVDGAVDDESEQAHVAPRHSSPLAAWPARGRPSRWQVGVGHVEDRRHAAGDRRPRAALEVLLLGVARVAEMDVAVDDPGHHVAVVGIEDLVHGRGREAARRTDRRERAVTDRDVPAGELHRCHDGATLDDQIEALLHGPRSYVRRTLAG